MHTELHTILMDVSFIASPSQGLPSEPLSRTSSDGPSTTTAVQPSTEGASAPSISHTVASTGKLTRKERKRRAAAAAQQKLLCTAQQQSGEEPSAGLDTDDMEVVEEPHSPESEELLASQSGSEDGDTIEVTSEPKCPVAGTVAGETSGAGGLKRKAEVEAAAARQTSQKRRKQGPPLGQSFDQAEKDNRLGVITIVDHPYTTLTRTQLQDVRTGLLRRLESSIDDNDAIIPRFQESGLRHGRFHLSCVDEYSFRWLKTAVADIVVKAEPAGSDDLHLQLVTPAELPKLLRADVYISGPPVGVPKFIKLLKGQNSGLFTERWLLRHQRSTAGGMLLVWSIDQESAANLQAVDDRPHFGLGRVSFRVSRGPGSKRAK